MKNSLFVIALCSASAYACTTFATFNAPNKSVLIAKNRDNNPDNQVIEIVVQPHKYKYIALSRKDVPDFVSAGINQYNLAVFNEVTIEYAKQAKGGIADDFSKDILQNYTNALAVIPDIPKLIQKYPDPVFYQIADKDNIVSIEVAPNYKYAYKINKTGNFAHTNNYQESALIDNYPYTTAEQQRVINSQTRYNRALALLQLESNISLGYLQTIALDRNAGNDDSIFRTGSNPTPTSAKSLAFFAVEINQHSSIIQAYLYNVGEKYYYNLTQEFWQQYPIGTTLLKPRQERGN